MAERIALNSYLNKSLRVLIAVAAGNFVCFAKSKALEAVSCCLGSLMLQRCESTAVNNEITSIESLNAQSWETRQGREGTRRKTG
jgi:hypothetical protein